MPVLFLLFLHGGDRFATLVSKSSNERTLSTIREQLPEGFQRAEYLLDHGMLDRVTDRKKLRDELISILHMLTGRPQPVKGDLPKPANPAVEATSPSEADGTHAAGTAAPEAAPRNTPQKDRPK